MKCRMRSFNFEPSKMIYKIVSSFVGSLFETEPQKLGTTLTAKLPDFSFLYW